MSTDEIWKSARLLVSGDAGDEVWEEKERDLNSKCCPELPGSLSVSRSSPARYDGTAKRDERGRGEGMTLVRSAQEGPRTIFMDLILWSLSPEYY